jgi:filamentous hemagglutinin
VVNRIFPKSSITCLSCLRVKQSTMKKTTIFDYFFCQHSSNALGGAGSSAVARLWRDRPSTRVSGHNHGSGAIRLRGYRVWILVTSACLFLATPVWSTDILRGQRNNTPASGGGGAGGAVAPGSVPNSATAQALAQAQAQAAARASDTLRRSTQNLAAQRAAQAAARQAALSGANNLGQNPNNPALTLPDVPDGLATGGLVPDSGLSSTGVANPVTTWTGANTPVQSTTTSGQIKVTVEQTQQQALLQWDTFNIGKNTNLDFDQSAGGANVRQWIAFNKINDPSQNPSQILGSITSQGQVYVINRNGIIFGGSSQVNTGSLVASSLPINDNLIERGLLNNPSLQFLFSSVDTNPNSFLSTVHDSTFTASALDPTQKTLLVLAAGTSPTVKYFSSSPTDTGIKTLIANTDFTTSTDPGDGKTVITLTSTGLAKVGTDVLSISYTPESANPGDVIVQAGAQLTAPTKDKVGGRIALVGANVRNAGTVSTPDGQAILAAGKQVGMTGHSSSDPSLRGLDVYVGQADAFTGLVENTGLIETARASTVAVGREIQQNGIINSSTSVDLNGRIDLLANYGTVASTLPNGNIIFEQRESGSVNFGNDSLTQILPELESTSKVVGTQLALSSLVNVQGQDIELGTQAILRAPSAALSVGSTAVDAYGNNLVAGLSLNAGTWLLDSGGRSAFTNTSGTVVQGAGSVIDVAGSQAVQASVADNIVRAELRGSELANSPLQREGALRGETIYFDVTQVGTLKNGRVTQGVPASGTTDYGTTWVGTPLADVSGYIGLVERTVGQLTASGGSASIRAGDGFVQNAGSSIDVSGGWVNYQGAEVTTTRVVSNGVVYDISEASPDLIYQGIYSGNRETSVKWGVDETTSSAVIEGGRFVQGYTQGGNGGSLSLSAPTMEIKGALHGKAFAGERQRNARTEINTYFTGNSALPSLLTTIAAPASSSLAIAFEKQNTDPIGDFRKISPNAPDVYFKDDSSGVPVGAVVLDPDLFADRGFGTFSLTNHNADVFVPAGVELLFPAAASVSIQAANMSLEGSLIAPSGSVKIGVTEYSPYDLEVLGASPTPSTPLPDPARGDFTLGAGALISTAGQWVDQRFDPNAGLFTTGGSILIDAYQAVFEVGSSLHVDGGGTINPRSRVAYADAGSITVRGGRDSGIISLIGGAVEFGSEITGFSGARGGSFSLEAPLLLFSDSSVPPANGALQFTSDFFNQGGFASFAFAGVGRPDPAAADTYFAGVRIASGTVIEPQVASVIATPTANSFRLDTALLPDGERTAPSVSFSSSGLGDNYNGQLIARGELVLESGAVVRVDPKGLAANPLGGGSGQVGSISFSGNSVQVFGSLYAPGGQISVRGGSSYVSSNTSNTGLPAVEIASSAILSTAGETIIISDPQGFRTGSVLPGGTVLVSGNVVAQSGALIDVSGTSGTIDLLPSYSGSKSAGSILNVQRVSTNLQSSAGSITLTGGQLLFSEATLRGRAGASSARGGTLTVGSGRFYPPAAIGTPLDTTLMITQSAQVIPASYLGGGDVLGVAPLDASSAPVTSHGYLGVDSFNQGGFDSLNLNGTVQFKGDVSIDLPGRVTLGTNGVVLADGQVSIKAGKVSLGTSFANPQTPAQLALPVFTAAALPYYLSPQFGTGELTLDADLIDVGNLSLQNIGKLSLLADEGDIRGNGILHIAGDLLLRASQIFPATKTIFTMLAYDHGGTEGSITVAPSLSNTRKPLPLSAGGQLDLYASNITLGGVLRAPIGTINIGWNGQGTAPRDRIANTNVPIARQITQTSTSVTSVSAVDPVTGLGVTIPYGVINESGQWIDPTGLDITLVGPPAKSINISGQNIDNQSGSVIDLRGGGELYAYQWVSGLGGTKDILESTTSYAILPSNSASYAPFDVDYGSSGLNYGDQIRLSGVSGLASGDYVLLPARYALLPGAYLITPSSSTPPAAPSIQPDGSLLVSGFRFNASASPEPGYALNASFEVLDSATLRQRADYRDNLAGNFFKEAALAGGLSVPRLPLDSGSLIFSATQSLGIGGGVLSQSPTGGLGSRVDISSPNAILIAAPGATAGAGILLLNAEDLSNFGADSLLIGGFRTTSTSGTQVTVTTSSLTVDNSGAPLVGPDVILVSSQTLNVSDGAQINVPSGTLARESDDLTIGSSSSPGSGDGALVRVTSDPTSSISRLGVTSSTVPSLTIGSQAGISGPTVILDSTANTSVAADVALAGNKLSLSTGRISLQLENPGAFQPNPGLVLSKTALDNLQATADSLTLSSYSSIDIYGTGSIGATNSEGIFPDLTFGTAAIRGFNQMGGSVVVNARTLTLDNRPGAVGPGTSPASTSGSLELNVGTIVIGSASSPVSIQGFLNTTATASQGLRLEGSGGLATAGNLTFHTPIVTASTAASHSISAVETLGFDNPSALPVPATTEFPLGARLNLSGQSVSIDNIIFLPSGTLTAQATNGAVVVGGTVDVGGTSRTYQQSVAYTSGGSITLGATNGSVDLLAGSKLSVAAVSAGGNAGTITIRASEGTLSYNGQLLGAGGQGGKSGNFILDVATLDVSPVLGGNDLSLLSNQLTSSDFQNNLSFRIRGGGSSGINNDVYLMDGTTSVARSFHLSSDRGSISITGDINAAGQTGGDIRLVANQNINLLDGASLSVAAQDFDNAGKGGSVYLAAGTQSNGAYTPTALGSGPSINLASGSSIDLSVAKNTNATTTAQNQSLGKFGGTLHLRAQQTTGNNEVHISAVDGAITGASKITVEGYQIFTPAGGTINSTAIAAVQTNGNTFGGNSVNMANRIFKFDGLSGTTTDDALIAASVIAPGAEFINTSGDLTLSADWNLATFRFGPDAAPGVLTMRASRDLVFNGTLSDGFNGVGTNLRLHTLMTPNTLVPFNGQSWSYNLTAGADFSSVESGTTLALNDPALSSTGGSLRLGKNAATPFSTVGGNAQTGTIIGTNPSTYFYQVIRTGTGDITISAARDVKLLNQFATIYTAGAAVADPTLGGTFDPPPTITLLNAQQGTLLGAVQQSPIYAAQYSMAGGNVVISAGQDIIHQTLSGTTLIDDSGRQLPNNWLNRRGYVDETGNFGVTAYGEVGSTSWWVDFSNFFQGIATLGGGNVEMAAGRDVANVDAVAATNARMAKGRPDASTLVELGGGDLTVTAGRDLNAGVYYVERGDGTLSAGRSVVTNALRTPSIPRIITPSANPFDSETWLPTTLFLGKGDFTVEAHGDLLLGPTLNTFLLPQGVNNTFWYKTYFSTYDSDNSVSVASLTGDVTMRLNTTLPNTTARTPIIQAWLQNVSLFRSGSPLPVSNFQPWLRLSETSVTPFSGLLNIMPSTLEVTSHNGDFNLAGNINLSPSPTGNLKITVQGALNALQTNGLSASGGVTARNWAAATINLSDADPSRINGITNPYAYQTLAGTSDVRLARETLGSLVNEDGVVVRLDLTFLTQLFQETGSTSGTNAVLQNKQILHTEGLLHLNDPEPLRIYTNEGDISGLRLFSAKSAEIVAGNDITDVAFYIQNVLDSDISVVASGRDIIAYNSNSPLRLQANNAPSNRLNAGETVLSGDIQISGPGALQVLAGRNLDLGTGAGNPDGTGVGITSIGNARNPFLPSTGAEVLAGAGLGDSAGLSNSQLDLNAFNNEFLNPATGGELATRYLPQLGELLGLSDPTNQQVWDAYQALPEDQKARFSLGVFYLVLRDAGRDRNDPDSEFAGTYTNGEKAIAALFPETVDWEGDITTRSRDIRTRSGGGINILTPGGGLTLASSTIGNPLSPPGIITEFGGPISIFTDQNVDIGISRIFTLRGGDQVIYSANGSIAAGSSSKTVQSAPPTRVVIDPQSADVQTDLAGLATGGGIGVLDTVPGVEPGNIDLVAPKGSVDAGDAGIRSSGNLNISAVQVLNAGNINVGGASSGTPVSAPSVSVGSLSSASSAAAGASSAAADAAKQSQDQASGGEKEVQPSLITVEVIGYGGGDGETDPKDQAAVSASPEEIFVSSR